MAEMTERAKEGLKRRQATYRAKHPEKCHERYRKWAEAHREHLRAYRKAYYEKNKDKIREYQKEYHKTY